MARAIGSITRDATHIEILPLDIACKALSDKNSINDNLRLTQL
jgi:hypothetical protein